MSTSASDQQHTSAEPEKHTFWTLPTTIEAVPVMPDRYTKPSELSPEKMKGKESDPSRMGVYVCLLDDKPHLHPSLHALHKHRLTIHGIPLPLDPANDLPVPQPSNNDTNFSAESRQEDVVMSPSSPSAGSGQQVGGQPEKAEWLMWKFSEEEANRRKSYLPLA
ncbi:uncharacterized protein I303_105016 [Kwoniella dejecticola CBS 10117]|uniref:Uncharacterized protein n=1 Tax=Kwoniella dejecticola CBS 10117 TaxID=1296121 RepID=A0A1A6A3Q0_9TREE|nr:uncharacterized protein I303_05538 [Kwoniella dejecticola CBS 10117]OBR84679.1 hypothetical protein I303_05538 [Kwoniella dejecticola CBS 10117]